MPDEILRKLRKSNASDFMGFWVYVVTIIVKNKKSKQNSWNKTDQKNKPQLEKCATISYYSIMSGSPCCRLILSQFTVWLPK